MPKYYKLTVHYNKINQNTYGVTLLVDDDIPRSSFQSAPQIFTTWSGEKEYIPPQIPYTIREMKLKPVAEVGDFVILEAESSYINLESGDQFIAKGNQSLLVLGLELDQDDTYIYILNGYDVKVNIGLPRPPYNPNGFAIKVKGNCITL